MEELSVGWLTWVRITAEHAGAASWSVFCGDEKTFEVAAGANCLGECVSHSTYPLLGLKIQHPTICTRHSITYVAHLAFVCVFFTFLGVTTRMKPPAATTTIRPAQTVCRGSILFISASTLAAVVGLANFGIGSWVLYSFWSGARPTHNHEWMFHFVQGLSWITIAFSLRIQMLKSTRIFARMWWLVTFLVATFSAVLAGLDLYYGAHSPRIDIILALTTWPVSCVLLACALLAGRPSIFSDANGLTDPLINGYTPNGNGCHSVGEKDSIAEDGSSRVTGYATAGLFSRMTFSWLDSLLIRGYKEPLTQRDVPFVNKENRAETATKEFQEAWTTQKVKDPLKPQSVFKTLVDVYGKSVMLNGLFALLKTITSASGPLVLRFFIDFAAGKQSFRGEGYTLVAILFCAKIVESLSQRHWYFGARSIGMRIRSSLVAAVYQKQLKLSSSGRQRHAAGEIVNYLSVDAYRIGEFPWWMHQVWVIPLQIAIASAILFYTVGLATIPGLCIVVITMFINRPLARSLQRAQVQRMNAQDERLRASTEVLHNMKIIKLQAWEDKFRDMVSSLRATEFKWLTTSQRRRSMATILFWMTPAIVSSVVFSTFCALGHTLTPSIAFTALAAFRIIQDPIRQVPEVLAVIIQAQVSLSRLGNYLQDDELQEDAVIEGEAGPMKTAVEIKDSTLSWEPTQARPTLRHISLKVNPKDRVAVCGAVGSGKSTLLHAILGEVPKLSGSVAVNGTIAYVAQSAWIQSGTLQENVLFGQAMDKTRYAQTLKACALDKDIQGMPHGDLTEIGERGINMSGGQKQRIQLARAVYRDADIYLLDDPFSAVDAHTQASLFKDCVMGALADKTVILVTHQVEFLPSVDRIVVMDGGLIKQQGRYDDLMKNGTAFKQLVHAHHEAMGGAVSSDQSATNGETPLGEIGLLRNPSVHLAASLSRGGSRGGSRRELPTQATQLTQQEERETGDSGTQIYREYVEISKGWWVCAGMVVAQTVFVILQMASNYWLAIEISNPAVSDALLIGVYATLSVLSGIFVFGRSQFFVALGLKGSKAFFDGINNTLFRAPMAFFDSTPLGRILNRLSSDMNLLDVDIPFSLGFVSTVSLEIVGVFVIVALVTWQVLAVVIPMLFVVGWLQRYYVTSARELMRVNGTTKAPIVNNFGETIQGSSTIRAFRMIDQFKVKSLGLIDVDASVFFHTFTAYEWLVLRLETLCALVLCTSALLMVVLPANQVNAGFAGLALAYGLTLNGVLVFFIQYQCTLASNIISVERIKQYMDIPSEAPHLIETCRPSPQWPTHGKVELQNLQIRYRPSSPLVLKGITCTFEGGQRVGVVGRTGSGKTTLISALFRLVEPCGGRMLIDGVDICSIGLHDLRSRLGIIPQEPTLFRGTVRTNLDPLGKHGDDQIWEALEKCQLADSIRQSPEKLDALVSDEGENWSVGQRQLFCMGRAILKRSRILVLDEATASIDTTTDAIIQRTIRKEFKNCTVVTVAHRIPTVVDSDQVLALTDGIMAEFDAPKKLLANDKSLFAKLVAEYWTQVNSQSGA